MNKDEYNIETVPTKSLQLWPRNASSSDATPFLETCSQKETRQSHTPQTSPRSATCWQKALYDDNVEWRE